MKSELKRNYNLDLLKIVSIIFVIILHYNNGTIGGLLLNTKPGTLNYFIARFSERKYVAGILRLLFGWNILWLIDLILIIVKGSILRVLNC